MIKYKQARELILFVKASVKCSNIEEKSNDSLPQCI